jgi:ABC-2 type transport system permease protein
MSATQPTVPDFDRAALGRPIAGPSARGGDARRLWHLTWTLAITDFKLTFFGSALGYLWQLMKPLMLFGVLYLVFSEFLDISASEEYFPVALLLGIVLFGFLSESTSQSVRSLVLREPLVRKVDFPRLAVPLASILTSVFNVLLNLVPVVVFLLAAGGRPRWSWLEVPLLLALLIALAAGLGMLLSALFVRYRDIEPIWDVILQAMFYATPIFYTVSLVKEKSGSDLIAKLIMCNPFAALLQQMRHALIDPSHLSAGAAMGGWVWVSIPAAIGVGLLALGYTVFAREAPRVAEDL